MKKRFKKIYIEITNICNLSCDFCMEDNRKKEYMTIANFEYILEQIKEYTDYIYLHVKGEPLIHPQINECIDIAHEKGLYINLTTNGTKIDNLKSKHVRQINYSMQSTNDVEQIRETITKMRKHIENTATYLSLRLWTSKIKENTNVINMLKEEFSEDIVIKDKKAIDKNVFISVEDEFTWPSLDTKHENSKGSCYGMTDHIAILVDGTVVPCCLDCKGIINLGNIFVDSIEDIISSQRAQDIFNGHKHKKMVEELCKKCEFKNRFNVSV